MAKQIYYHKLREQAKNAQKWQDLTEEEIGEIYRAGWKNNMDFAEAIQAKLREKNTPKCEYSGLPAVDAYK